VAIRHLFSDQIDESRVRDMREGSGQDAGQPADCREGEQDWAALCKVGLLVVLVLAMLVAVRVLGRATPGQYMVLTSPSVLAADAMDLVYEAGGGVMTFSAVPGLVIAKSAAPDFAQMVRLRGAWLVLPAPGRFGCLSRKNEVTS
jgi:hypothetical protein